MLRQVGDPTSPEFERFIGLDLSLTKTGVVVVDFQGEVLFSTECGYSLTKSDTERSKTERLVSIASDIIRVVKNHSFEVRLRDSDDVKIVRPQIGIENYAFSIGRAPKRKSKKKSGFTGAGRAFDLGELGGVVKTQLLLRFQISPAMLASSTCRKVVFGDGRLPKKNVVSRLAERGLAFSSGDTADAYVVAETLRKMKHEPEPKKSRRK